MRVRGILAELFRGIAATASPEIALRARIEYERRWDDALLELVESDRPGSQTIH